MAGSSFSADALKGHCKSHAHRAVVTDRLALSCCRSNRMSKQPFYMYYSWLLELNYAFRQPASSSNIYLVILTSLTILIHDTYYIHTSKRFSCGALQQLRPPSCLVCNPCSDMTDYKCHGALLPATWKRRRGLQGCWHCVQADLQARRCPERFDPCARCSCWCCPSPVRATVQSQGVRAAESICAPANFPSLHMRVEFGYLRVREMKTPNTLLQASNSLLAIFLARVAPVVHAVVLPNSLALLSPIANLQSGKVPCEVALPPTHGIAKGLPRGHHAAQSYHEFTAPIDQQ